MWEISSSRFCVATTFYGISFNITGFGLNLYLTQLVYALIEFPTKIVIYYLLDMIGRRSSIVGALVLSGVCLGVNILIPEGKDVCRVFGSGRERGADVSTRACLQTRLLCERSWPSLEKRSLPHHLQFLCCTIPSSILP